MTENRGASKEAIQFHYDFGNDFYAEWLDETMTYSAGIWPDSGEKAVSLRSVQERKLDWHLEGARLGQGRRLLDVGCGWGGLIERAQQTRGFDRAVGLTLSEAQAAWIRERHAEDPIEIEVKPWQAFRAAEPFDALISIGAFEHFARPGMTRAQKLASYEDFFAFAAKSLTAGGTISLQTIVWMEIEAGKEAESLPADFFPESDLPYVSEVVQAAERHFHMTRFHNRPRDYSKTLRVWLKSIRDKREALTERYGEEAVARYSKFFTGFILGFDRGAIGLTRMKFVKR
ncbi:MAG: hypothetical protein Kilf2KO_25430 [Rhodospirillales bacterium]